MKPTIDPERLVSSGLPYNTVYARLARGWDEHRAYLPPRAMCTCGCKGEGTVQIGTGMYCAATARILLAMPRPARKPALPAAQLGLFGGDRPW